MVDLHAWRVIDANANRASEGLRVLEEVARLVHEDPRRAATLKKLRHQLSSIVAQLDRNQRLAARSTAHDAGTGISTASEQSRGSIAALITAEVSRVGEALRALEEFSKLIDADISAAFKQLRYQAYDELAEVELAWTLHHWLSTLRLCLLCDCSQPLDNFADYLEQLAHAGLRCVQIRDKRLEGRALTLYARRAVEVMNQVGGQVIVNDRVDVALAAGAAGVHVGQDDLHIDDVRRIAGHRLAIGVSTHDIDQVRQAQQAGADYIGCGPTFPSRTKNFDNFAGLAFLKQVANETPAFPALAIGGIDRSNIDQVVSTGIGRVALSAAVHRANSPADAVKQLLEALQR